MNNIPPDIAISIPPANHRRHAMHADALTLCSLPQRTSSIRHCVCRRRRDSGSSRKTHLSAVTPCARLVIESGWFPLSVRVIERGCKGTSPLVSMFCVLLTPVFCGAIKSVVFFKFRNVCLNIFKTFFSWFVAKYKIFICLPSSISLSLSVCPKTKS